MSRDQRVQDNWALIYGQELAIQRKEPLIIIFCLFPKFKGATFRAYKFMIDGLKELQNELKQLKIPFTVECGSPEQIIPDFIEEHNIGTLITDFSPLRTKREELKKVSNKISIPFYEVDTHNIIPVWEVSSKKEYAAYTLRKKIKEKLSSYLEEFSKVKEHPHTWEGKVDPSDLSNYLSKLELEKLDNEIKEFIPGARQAKKELNNFIIERLDKYAKQRNNPNIDGTSNLSPYLHFGQLSSQRVVLEAQKEKKIGDLKGTFYDEIIVRKELSDNFCYYEPNYDNFQGFHSWAKETLNEHREDTREYLYTLEEFEKAKTHDDAWNAAQLQMVKRGKMHGYMRMYWGKKILEWTESPEQALKIAIYLNDKYELDGRDPNGYTGIAWSIGGIHDRAWKKREIYGKVRYMSYNGLKRKFNLQEYINTYT